MFQKHNTIGSVPLFSSPAVSNPVPPVKATDWVRLRGTHDGRAATFGLDEQILEKHLLLVGSTGCGKTTTFVQIVNQLQQRMTNNDVMIIFDTKGDYTKRVNVQGEKLFIGNSDPYRQVSKKWNIFKEILLGHFAKYDNEVVVSYTQEICRSLFADREKRSNNPFFPNAARDLLAGLIISLIRTGYDPTSDPTFMQDFFHNQGLIEFLSTRDADALCDMLGFDDDLRSIQSYISGSSEQASGVLSEMYSVVREVFTGIFAQKSSRTDGFSIREFVHNRGRKTLFIEYDLSLGSSLTPIYRLLIDLALKEALSHQSTQGNVYIICDEFRLLPHLQHIDDGVNFGRSLGVKVIAGLQSIEQLFEVYQESRGRNIAAGFSTVFAYHTTDPSTINYLTQAYGQYELREEYYTSDNKHSEYRRRDNVISSWDLVHMDVGEAIICPAFGIPFTFKFDK